MKDIQEKLKKILKLARKQMASMICLVIAIVGLVLSYWPTQGWFSDLGNKVGQSIAMGGQVTSLMTRERHMPSVSLDSSASQVLPFFPTDDAIRKATDAMVEVHNQSVAILDTAGEINKHQPLVPGVLPAGGDIAGESFRRAYRRAITDDYRILNWPAPEVQSPSNPIPALKAGRTITDEQIHDALDEAQKDINARFEGPDGQIPGELRAEADADLAEATRTVPLKRALEAARQIKVYLEPGALKIPAAAANINGAVGVVATGDMWTAQLWLWLDEDVATAVARANAAAADVTESPIKQITDLTIKEPGYVIVGDPTAGKDDAALTPALDVTPTGRVCNGMYDVVQFDLKLDVDGRRVAEVLDALERGQFITVLDVQFQAVDPSDLASKHFIYGNGPIVQLDIACEELILHNWSAKIQPPDGGTAKYVTAPAAGAGAATVAPTNFIFPINVHSGS